MTTELLSPSLEMQALIETGFSGSAVAGYGTSVEEVVRMFRTGVVPPYPAHHCIVDYQQEIVGCGGNLYYVLPFLRNFRSEEADLAHKLLKGFGESFTTDEARAELACERMLRRLQRYAHDHAIKDAFNRAVGAKMDVNEILALASYDSRSGFSELKHAPGPYAYNYYDFVDDPSTDEEWNQAVKTYGKSRVEKGLRMAMARKGVVLFFNRDFFRSGDVHIGIEDETELFVVSPRPLPLSVISGIHCYTEREMELLCQGAS